MKKGIVISCVDPRLHHIFPDIAKLMGVDQVYAFRFPGPDGILATHALANEKPGMIMSVRRLTGLADISAFAVIGHTNCAGHNVSDDEHRTHTVEAAKTLRSELGVDVPVLAILAVRGETDADWSHEVLETL